MSSSSSAAAVQQQEGLRSRTTTKDNQAQHRDPSSSSDDSGIICSIIVPAYHERDNLEPLTRRVYDAMLSAGWRHQQVELIVVDDNSCDGSVAVMERLREGGGKDGNKKYANARIIVRATERGLSSAVLRGFREASGSLLLCMDADLQHPPEKVPELFAAIRHDNDDGDDEKKKTKEKGAEFAIGTRYGGAEFAVDKNWPVYRRIVSQGARMLARPLTPLSDPMTGFFALRRSCLDKADKINSIGFKICLELAVKCHVREPVAEVPIHFGVRTAGESKLSGDVIVHYLLHLADLYSYKFPWLVPAAVLLAAALLLLLLVVLYVFFV